MSARIPAAVLDVQRDTSDPAVSAWVAANAGSGKTHVLAQRVIRLLLNGTAPEKILCLTYTKAAAANMANRVFETLGKWTALDDAALDAEIAQIEGRRPDPRRRIRARRLFTQALDTPGGLKVQTIHAFCTRFLTHMLRLTQIETPLANFFASGVLLLGPTMGPILWQFPPRFRFNAERFERFFDLLPRDTEAAAELAQRHDERIRKGFWTETDAKRRIRHAVEIRDESFLVP